MRVFLSAALLISAAAFGQVPENLTVEGVPPITPALRQDVGRYLEFRSATFVGWHPERREMLISTRFADTDQLHGVKMPGGARRQMTFGTEPIRSGRWQSKLGKCIVFAQDTGGGEFYQLHRLDLDGRVTLLTDGKSRNTGLLWARSGARFAYTSTRRNGKDNDIYVQDPFDPASAKQVLQVTGGGWEVLDWSRDEQRLLLGEYISANESRLHLLDLASGKAERISPDDGEKVTWSGAQFTADGQTVITVTDRKSEFRHLAKIALATKEISSLGAAEPGIVEMEEFELSPDGKALACVANREGACELIILQADTGTEITRYRGELGVIAGLHWRETSDEVGFTLNSPRVPTDACSLQLPRKADGGGAAFTQWTESETGGLDAKSFATAERVTARATDDLRMSGFLYRPDPKKFPGKRPCIVNIHGGPEGQSQPQFIGRSNYFISELGIAIFYPNVRGSAGFGKTFLALDNGF
jgi:dipeptidyl aminopeptidase/acylaminoacyl peptidase